MEGGDGCRAASVGRVGEAQGRAASGWYGGRRRGRQRAATTGRRRAEHVGSGATVDNGRRTIVSAVNGMAARSGRADGGWWPADCGRPASKNSTTERALHWAGRGRHPLRVGEGRQWAADGGRQAHGFGAAASTGRAVGGGRTDGGLRAEWERRRRTATVAEATVGRTGAGPKSDWRSAGTWGGKAKAGGRRVNGPVGGR